MSGKDNDQELAMAFARLAKAASRRKIYARKAAKENRPEISHLLRAMAASEAAQSRRLFNSLIGRVDKSDRYLETIFEEEVQELLESYTALIDNIPASRPALHHAVSQLKAAETRLRSFFSRDSKGVKVAGKTRYFVCRFCGYLSTDTPPEKCPICTAPLTTFEKIS